MAGLVAELRALSPQRPLTVNEAMRVAELQANRLLAARRRTEPPTAEITISGLPRVQVERISPLPVSGAAHWTKGRWLIVLNGAEPQVRQRFSLAHEFKHIIDAPLSHVLYPTYQGTTEEERAERVADFFAACVLMPRPWLKRAWGQGTHELRALAALFAVSQAAMRVRLLQVGLIEAGARCGAAR